MTITGAAAALTWGYHRAATVQDWTAEHTGERWTVTGTLVDADTFRLSQQPLVFVATHQGGAWRWPIEELQITGVALTARLGPRER